MSRQFNPVIAAYNNLKIDEDIEREEKPKTSGLLSPSRMKNEKEDIEKSEPLSIVYKHVAAMRKKRMEEKDG
tara:strand:- start:362 stop:577 length:216 start_codon:yes stop_codon:yes gene_type:complete